MKLKITTVGNSAGVILPKEVLAKLNVAKGDHLYLVESPQGMTLTRYDASFEEQMEATGEATRRYRNALRELAK